MNNFNVFDLNDLKKALTQIQLLYNNKFQHHSQVNSDKHFNLNSYSSCAKPNDLVNITLYIQHINSIEPFYLSMLEEDYNGMLYTVKMILMAICKLLNENLTITLTYKSIHNLNSIEYRLIVEKTSRFISIIKELQQELYINSEQLFLQINNNYNIDCLNTINLLLQNKNLDNLEIKGGLILGETLISNALNTIKEQHLQQLIKNPILQKLSSIKINFTNSNNYEKIFNAQINHNKFEIILEKERSQLLHLFYMIKNLINQNSNIVNFEIYFGEYNLAGDNINLLKILNVLPKEYKILRQIYTNSVQNSILINIQNKLQKCLLKLHNMEINIANLKQISIQPNVVHNQFLTTKLEKDINELEKKQKVIILRFNDYITLLKQKQDPGLFYYLEKFYQYKKAEFKIPSEHSIITSKIYELPKCDVSNLSFPHKYRDYLKNYSSPQMIIESTENQILLFSQLNDYVAHQSAHTIASNNQIAPRPKLCLAI